MSPRSWPHTFRRAERSRRTQRGEIAIARLAAIVGASYDAIIGKDLDSLVTTWNLGAERLFGYSAADMIGQPIKRIIPGARQGAAISTSNSLPRTYCPTFQARLSCSCRAREPQLSLQSSPVISMLKPV